jgi:sodium pump decarboxylase gamma subunit
MEYSNLFVCLMGLGIVFLGLICIIALTYLMSAVCKVNPQKTAELPVAAAPAAPEPNRQELVAAVSAALAENLGTDITGIRILSMKKL